MTDWITHRIKRIEIHFVHQEYFSKNKNGISEKNVELLDIHENNELKNVDDRET